MEIISAGLGDTRVQFLGGLEHLGDGALHSRHLRVHLRLVGEALGLLQQLHQVHGDGDKPVRFFRKIIKKTKSASKGACWCDQSSSVASGDAAISNFVAIICAKILENKYNFIVIVNITLTKDKQHIFRAQIIILQ